MNFSLVELPRGYSLSVSPSHHRALPSLRSNLVSTPSDQPIASRRQWGTRRIYEIGHASQKPSNLARFREEIRLLSRKTSENL